MVLGINNANLDMCTDINMEIGRTSLAFYIKKNYLGKIIQIKIVFIYSCRYFEQFWSKPNYFFQKSFPD